MSVLILFPSRQVEDPSLSLSLSHTHTHTTQDFADFGEKLEIVSKSGTVAVIGSASALEDVSVSALGLEMKKLL